MSQTLINDGLKVLSDTLLNVADPLSKTIILWSINKNGILPLSDSANKRHYDITLKFMEVSVQQGYTLEIVNQELYGSNENYINVRQYKLIKIPPQIVPPPDGP